MIMLTTTMLPATTGTTALMRTVATPITPTISVLLAMSTQMILTKKDDENALAIEDDDDIRNYDNPQR